MIEATITYKDGAQEDREFSTWTAYAKFIDDNAGTIREADADDLHPTQRKTKSATSGAAPKGAAKGCQDTKAERACAAEGEGMR